MYTFRLILLLSGLLWGLQVQAQDVSRALLEIHERLYIEQDGLNIFPGTTVYEPSLVAEFYAARDYQPAWTDAEYAREMLQLLKSSEDEGLNPEDYHYSELLALQEQYQRSWADKNDLHAQAEVLLTDGILLYAKHLKQGKVDPRSLDASWNYKREELVPSEVAGELSSAIDQQQVAEILEGLKPEFAFYGLMKQRLKYYRELATTEQFSPLPVDKVLHPGDTHSNVRLLRQRLKQLTYLTPDAPEADHFDDAVKVAVQQFQRDHNLDDDGVVGQQSFDILNLSFADKVDRLRVNLDRLRWINETISDDFIVVNIAGYELYYMRNKKAVWETPVMVGKIQTRTPVFHERLRYLELNPTWTPPRSLIRGLIPKFKKDPQYAIEKGYKFYDSSGKEVSASSINWSAQSANSFPYRVVQMPGPSNAMGRVKFMFPNKHAIYLHDTPSRDLFSRDQRAFSAGCIRVEDPLELARVLLDDPENWSAEKIQGVIDSGTPKEVVRLQRDIDVLLMYWTVSPSADDRVQFHADVYQMDPPALALLNAPPRSADLAKK